MATTKKKVRKAQASGAVTTSNVPSAGESGQSTPSPGDELRVGLQQAVAAQESSVPVEERVEAEKKRRDAFVGAPAREGADLYNGRGADFGFSHDAKFYLLPAGKVTRVTAGAVGMLANEPTYLHAGVVVVPTDSSPKQLAALKKEAEEEFVRHGGALEQAAASSATPAEEHPTSSPVAPPPPSPGEKTTKKEKEKPGKKKPAKSAAAPGAARRVAAKKLKK